MNIVVDPELKSYIDPLTPAEHDALERSLLAEGCRDALVLWGDVLVDGHNRHGICEKHGIPFKTVQNPRFQSIEDVHLWMIDQHLGRRSVSDFQRGVLALRKKEIVAGRVARVAAPAQAAAPTGDQPGSSTPPWELGEESTALPPPAPLASREAIAKAARLSSNQVSMIEKIQKQATPEVVAAVRSGAISINAAAAIAGLPAEEQVAAASAGADELKQAAKRARDVKRKSLKGGTDAAAGVADTPSTRAEVFEALQLRVAELTAENVALRERVSDLERQLANR